MTSSNKKQKAHYNLFFVKNTLSDYFDEVDSWQSPTGQIFSGNSDVLRLVKDSRIWE